MISSRLFLAVMVVGALLACGEVPEERGETSPPVSEEDSVATPDTLVMPAIPEARHGYLVARGAGAYALDGAWEAWTGTCDDPPMLEVIGRQEGLGVLVLLQLPPAGERVANYPVTLVESGAPTPPASQIAVQLLEGSTGRAFQGMDGSVDVTRYDDRVSARFAVTLREIATDDEQKYAGIFEGVPLEPLPQEQCAEIKAALEAADSAATDTVPQPREPR